MIHLEHARLIDLKGPVVGISGQHVASVDQETLGEKGVRNILGEAGVHLNWQSLVQDKQAWRRAGQSRQGPPWSVKTNTE